jgi:methyl-accepting chemotaxis protein
MHKKGFHHFFSRRLALYLFFGLVLSNLTFFLLAGKPLGDSYSEAFRLLRNIDETLLTTILSITAYVLILIIPLIFFASVLMSHRVSGPVFRFERSAEALANGDLTVRVRLRDKDEMKDAAARMDGTIDKFRTKITGLKEKSLQIKEDIDLLLERSAQGSLADNEMARLTDKIIDVSNKLKADISQFKL